MKRVMGATLALAVALLAALGCVDTSEIDYHEPPLRGTADAGLLPDGGVSPAVRAACRSCVTEDTCGKAYASCEANDRCRQIIDCFLDRYCMNYDANDLAHLPQCLLDCAALVGITSQDDPIVPLIASVTVCGTAPDQCGPVCTIGAKSK